MQKKISTGRLSDVIERRRADWSEINTYLKALEPGERVSFECPPDIKVSAFRSTILTNGRRFHRGDWRLSTITEKQTIHCFLVSAPSSAPGKGEV